MIEEWKKSQSDSNHRESATTGNKKLGQTNDSESRMRKMSPRNYKVLAYPTEHYLIYNKKRGDANVFG